MITIFYAFLGLAFIAIVGVLIMTFAEKHQRVMYVGAAIIMIPWILMTLDMVGVI